MKRIGFLGFGEASSNIAVGLLTEHQVKFYAYDVDAKRANEVINSLNIESNVQLASSLREALQFADMFFVAIPGKYDEELFDEILACAPQDKVFLDLCTARPSIKAAIEARMRNTGCSYLDIAVMGSVPALKHKVPMYASGHDVSIVQEMADMYHLDISVVGDKAGDASLIKICRSIYMKGLAALSIEVTEVCEFYGVKDKVYESLAKSLDTDSFRTYTPRLINGTKKHIKRRMQEVKECLEIIEEAGLNSDMTKGTLGLYERML
jgi:3-hydroxyisobutyrate dehydrogenase-like beta-hydroxyacid dehydrogenase